MHSATPTQVIGQSAIDPIAHCYRFAFCFGLADISDLNFGSTAGIATALDLQLTTPFLQTTRPNPKAAQDMLYLCSKTYFVDFHPEVTH